MVAVRRDEVFVELGGREQGCLPLRQFDSRPSRATPSKWSCRNSIPTTASTNSRLPGRAVEVADWTDLDEGMLVEAQVTGHNTGGLECEVNHIRGFIPISQVALYRVEDLAQFVGQRITCIVTEANPMRRNLVLSRRAVLEREKEEARQKFFDSLAPGQVHEGVVRKIMDFGAFVDIGGVDGLLHVSQLAWGRVNHPSEVLAEGQTIRVKIEKIDRDNRQDQPLLSRPAGKPLDQRRGQVSAQQRRPRQGDQADGVRRVRRVGAGRGRAGPHLRAFPQAGVRASDIVHEGDEVEVLVLSVNTEAQRISLSMKALSKPEPTKKEKEAAQPRRRPRRQAQRRSGTRPTLQGGLGKAAGGDRFGLKW